MDDREPVDRKTFLSILGRAGAATCLCAAALDLDATLLAQGSTPPPPPQSKPAENPASRAARRMEFVDTWVPTFFAAMDAELDEASRRRVMAANGKACFSKSRADVKRRPDPATREQIAAWVAGEGKGKGYAMEGDAVFFAYEGSADTGRAGQRVCLCPTAEGQAPGRVSPTFCWCSVGYVKEMHERVFGRPLKVELTESVLMGNARCRFRITLA